MVALLVFLPYDRPFRQGAPPPVEQVVFDSQTIQHFPHRLVDEVIDPTGAGDTYAGAAMGYIAREDSIDIGTIKSAVVYGGIVASYTVQDFSLERLKSLTMEDIEKRCKLFRNITTF